MPVVNNNECWSTNDEDYVDTTLPELIEDRELKVGDVVFVGETDYTSPRVVDADDVIEDIVNRLYDEFGEHADSSIYDIENNNCAKYELEQFLKEWQDKHISLTCYHVKNTRPYTITEEDMPK